MKSQKEAANLLKQLTPDQQALARTLATLKIENKMLREALAKTKAAYDSIFKPFLVIVHASGKEGYRIHESQFLRFKDEYRIAQRYDEETKEVVFELKTLKDD